MSCMFINNEGWCHEITYETHKKVIGESSKNNGVSRAAMELKVAQEELERKLELEKSICYLKIGGFGIGKWYGAG